MNRRHPGGVVILLLAALGLLLAPVPQVRADTGSCQPLDDAGLVAQLVGAPVRTTVMDDELRTMVAQHAGTAVLFGQAVQDAEQVTALIADLDAAAPAGLPPLVAVDEEGGRVSRLGRAGVTVHLPSAREQAAGGTAQQVREGAATLGRQMADLGVDLDLGPVLDVTGAAPDTIIGDRSFSADPALAGAYARAFADGLRDGGVATTGKHFPDHGLTTTDTHTASAPVTVSRQQLRDVHLQPYRIALPALDAIMLSHLRVDALDPTLPVSLSAPAVAFLRAELGFDGVVMTDDLSMQAVADVTDQPTAAVMVVTAGADLVLIGRTADAAGVHAALLTALQEGELPRSRVTTAARRVLALKGMAPADVTCLAGPGHFSRAR